MRKPLVLALASLAIGLSTEACMTSAVGGGDTNGAGGAPSPSGTSSGSSGSSGQPVVPSGDAPVITNLAPLAGDYGTVVTITGDNFDAPSTTVVLDGPAEPRVLTPAPADQTSAAGAIVVSWSRTEIKFKYPFPAEGGVHVKSDGGQADGGSFAPSWRPGSPVSGAFDRRSLLSAVSPSAGTIVAAFDGSTGPQIVTAGADGAVHAKAFERGTSALVEMSLYASSAGGVDGVFGAGGNLWQLTSAEGAPSTSSTGVAALDAAGGSDDNGAYAWIRKSDGTIARVRPPSWAETGEIVTDPTPASAPGPSMAVAADQTLYVGWGYDDGGSFPLYDETAWPIVRRLRPGQTSFDAQESAGPGADDTMIWTRLLAGPDGRVATYYCAEDSSVFTSEVDCAEGYVGGPTGRPTFETATDYAVGFGEAGAMAAVCGVSDDVLSMGPDDQGAAAVPMLFPCPGIVAVAVDPTGAGVLLVQSGKYLYAPTKR